MMSVDVVIGNTLAAEAMVEMINKNIAAYLTYFLPTIGCSKEFIKDLLSAAVDPSLLHEVEYCTWEEKTLTLTTPKDVEKAKNKSIEDAAWYQNNFGVHMEKKEKKKKKHVAPENVYQLDEEHTYVSLNDRPGKYAGSPGAATIDLGKKKRPGEIDVDADDKAISAMSGFSGLTGGYTEEELNNSSKEELIAMFKRGNISGKTGSKGSTPKGNYKSRSGASDDEESSSSGDDSVSSSSSSEGTGSGESAATSG